MSLLDEREALIETLTDMLGDLAAIVTCDAQTARPTPGRLTVLVEPPEIVFDSFDLTTTNWSVVLIAGTMATQADALTILADGLERLQAERLNMKTAKPVSFQLAGVGSLAAYEIVLNPLELLQEEQHGED